MTPRRYWASILAAAVSVSVAGNIGHAWISAPHEMRVPAAVAAALPPLALLGITEGLMRSAGAVPRRLAYRAGIMGALLIGAIAFVLSFAALRDLAVALGQPAAVAAGWPLLADATIAVSGLMLLATKPMSTPDQSPSLAVQSPVAGPAEADVTSGDRVDAEPDPDPAERWLETAHGLVERDVVRADPAAVAAALAALDAGASQRSAALASGLHRETVRRIADATAEAVPDAELRHSETANFVGA